jgi:hypothetical protein
MFVLLIVHYFLQDMLIQLQNSVFKLVHRITIARTLGELVKHYVHLELFPMNQPENVFKTVLLAILEIALLLLENVIILHRCVELIDLETHIKIYALMYVLIQYQHQLIYSDIGLIALVVNNL